MVPGWYTFELGVFWLLLCAMIKYQTKATSGERGSKLRVQPVRPDGECMTAGAWGVWSPASSVKKQRKMAADGQLTFFCSVQDPS